VKRSFFGAVVVISGAGGGLGRALAERFGRAGSRVVLLDRDADAVHAAASALASNGVEALGLACDVTDARACEAAVRATVERHGRLDVLVNNAGITHRSPFAATQLGVLRRVVDVNLFGAIHLTHAALPHLQRSRGLVIALSSVAGYTPLIARTGYAASKHALHGFFDSLRTELAPDGVEVLLACPSFVATGIDRNALGPTGGAATHPQVVSGRRLQPAAVADRIVRGAERHRRLLLIGGTARAAWWLGRLWPGLYARIMARRLRDEMR
jgi:NAD(P)-dependent dehydrogenase (short-subunit alcohol dehydrogenase family)